MTRLADGTMHGLTAGDAERFDQVAAGKRAAAECGGDPAYAAQLAAEAGGIEALAAKLRDPAACGLPVYQRGRETQRERAFSMLYRADQRRTPPLIHTPE